MTEKSYLSDVKQEAVQGTDSNPSRKQKMHASIVRNLQAQATLSQQLQVMKMLSDMLHCQRFRTA